MNQIELKALAIELAAALPPPPPARTEVIFSTGEALSARAMALARFYESAGFAQRVALDALASAFHSSEPEGRSA